MAAYPTSEQLRGARAMLNWSLLDLARRCSVSVSTVRRAEQNGTSSIPAEKLDFITAALIQAGVAFSDDGQRGVSVTLETARPANDFDQD